MGTTHGVRGVMKQVLLVVSNASVTVRHLASVTPGGKESIMTVWLKMWKKDRVV